MSSILGRRVAALLAGLIGAGAQAQVVHLPDVTYQGRLAQDGQPANGPYDLAFTLHDATSGGNTLGAPQVEAQFPAVDGLFTVSLAFPGVFSGGQSGYGAVGVPVTSNPYYQRNGGAGRWDLVLNAAPIQPLQTIDCVF